jgi:endonuclease/exonuclease/phosphatase family metal-dependent hydrolase
VIEVRHLDLSVASREPRAALDVDLGIAGETVRCIVTHFGLGFRERLHQVRALCRLVDEIQRPVTLLLGDFNEWVPMRRSLLHLDSRLGRSYSARTFPSRRPVLPLDRIWVRPRHTVLRVWTLRDSHTRIASDHLPLCATVSLDPALLALA